MEEIKILDNGESEVQVATIGTVVGSDKDGNPIEQNFSEDALKAIAENQTDEILIDADHSSEKGGSTEAKGWLSGLNFVPGVGLFGKIKWTDIGKKLIENRVFRWLSPAWLLNDNKEPAFMTSCALTNKPSQYGRIDPIINSEPNKETIEMNMTKEELVSLIKEVVLNACPEKKEEEKKEVTNEAPEKKEEEAKEETKEEVKEETKEEAKEEVKNEEVPEKSEGEKLVEDLEKKEEIKEEVKEEAKEEVKNEEVPETKEEEKKEEKKEEVVSEAALNAQPQATLGTIEPEWTKLSGKAFFDWLAKHPEAR